MTFKDTASSACELVQLLFIVESGADVKMFLFVFEKVSNIKCRKMMQENAVFTQKTYKW